LIGLIVGIIKCCSMYRCKNICNNIAECCSGCANCCCPCNKNEEVKAFIHNYSDVKIVGGEVRGNENTNIKIMNT